MAAELAVYIYFGNQVISFDAFFARQWSRPWQAEIEQALAVRTNPARHGDLSGWQQALAELPTLDAVQFELDQRAINLIATHGISTQQSQQLRAALKRLMPWRKGPY